MHSFHKTDKIASLYKKSNINEFQSLKQKLIKKCIWNEIHISPNKTFKIEVLHYLWSKSYMCSTNDYKKTFLPFLPYIL